MKKLTNLAWIDLEMTGLDPQKDVILEIASLVTDKDLNIIAHGPSFVIKQPQYLLDKMVEVVKTMHTNSGLTQEVLNSTIDLVHAQAETLNFFSQYCFIGVTPLCGNSIWQDRRFLRKHMAELDAFFSYRIIDVSSIKELVRRWYPDNPATEFAKAEGHRAMPDIVASVKELEHYRINFFKP